MRYQTILAFSLLLAATSAASAHTYRTDHDGLQTGRSVHVDRTDQSSAPTSRVDIHGSGYDGLGTATSGPSGGLPDRN